MYISKLSRNYLTDTRKRSNMSLNYSKRSRYTLRLKFGSLMPSPSNFWSKYALMDVSCHVGHIQLIFHFFKCYMELTCHFALPHNIYMKWKDIRIHKHLIRPINQFLLNSLFDPFLAILFNFYYCGKSRK